MVFYILYSKSVCRSSTCRHQPQFQAVGILLYLSPGLGGGTRYESSELRDSGDSERAGQDNSVWATRGSSEVWLQILSGESRCPEPSASCSGTVMLSVF